MKERLRFLIDQIRKHLEVLSYIVVILGVPVFFYQQWQITETRRTEETLKFVTMFQQERVALARATLFLSWVKYSKDIELINAGPGIPQLMLERWVEKMIEISSKSNPEKNLINAIYVMTDFFDQLYLCVRVNVCREEPARLYFHEFSFHFYHLYGYKVEEIRGSLSIDSFGSGIRYFAAARSSKD